MIYKLGLHYIIPVIRTQLSHKFAESVRADRFLHPQRDNRHHRGRAGRYSVRPARMLEPSAGVGVFVDSMLRHSPNADVMAFEMCIRDRVDTSDYEKKVQEEMAEQQTEKQEPQKQENMEQQKEQQESPQQTQGRQRCV